MARGGLRHRGAQVGDPVTSHREPGEDCRLQVVRRRARIQGRLPVEEMRTRSRLPHPAEDGARAERNPVAVRRQRGDRARAAAARQWSATRTRHPPQRETTSTAQSSPFRPRTACRPAQLRPQRRRYDKASGSSRTALHRPACGCRSDPPVAVYPASSAAHRVTASALPTWKAAVTSSTAAMGFRAVIAQRP
jgi:hypothetical protein